MNAFLPFLLLLSSIHGLQIDPKPYTLKQSPYNNAIKTLGSEIDTIDVKSIFDGARRTLDLPNNEMKLTPWFARGFQWDSSERRGESTGTTVDWVPQGVSTISDVGENGIVGNSNSTVGITSGLLVSWIVNASNPNALLDKGARVTFVRKGMAPESVAGKAYTHALLVEPYLEQDGKPNFRTINMTKGGGIIWRGSWLFISDAGTRSLRVFDIDSAMKVDTIDGTRGFVGHWAQGDKANRRAYVAAEHEYIVPQAYTYTPTEQPHTSENTIAMDNISLDRNSTPPALIASESAPPNRDSSTFARWKFNKTSNLLETNDKGIATAFWAWRTNVNNCNGLAFVRDTYWMMSSTEAYNKSDILVWKPGSWADEFEDVFPPGGRGMSYDPVKQEAWFVTSFPNRRYVMSLRADQINSTITLTNGTSAPTVTVTPRGTSRAVILRKEQIAGIAVGAFAVITSSILAGCVIYRRRAKTGAWFGKPELDGSESSHTHCPTCGSAGELPAEERRFYEMEAGWKPPELPPKD